MHHAKLILANFDARMPKIEIKPKNSQTKVTLSARMYNEETDTVETVKIVFTDTAAIDFQINYFDNMKGAEVLGLYEITDPTFKERLTKDIFARRKEIYLLEGTYAYEENDPHDMLNTFDITGRFAAEMDGYHAYVQNVDAGVYIIVAKAVTVVK